MPKIKHHTFVISTKWAERRFTGFVDMLRYDQARVIEADPTFIVLNTQNRPPTDGRWASFGLYILAQQTGDFPDITHLKEQAKDKLPL